MNLDHKFEEGICIVFIDGNITLDKTSKIRGFVNKLLENSSLKSLVLNLSKVEFIDSSGIGLIASIFGSLKKKKLHFALSDVNQKANDIFFMIKLDKILEIFEDDKQAFEELRKR